MDRDRRTERVPKLFFFHSYFSFSLPGYGCKKILLIIRVISYNALFSLNVLSSQFLAKINTLVEN